jgi:hypothetical protein
MKNIWKDRVKIKQDNKTIQERREKLMESLERSEGKILYETEGVGMILF